MSDTNFKKNNLTKKLFGGDFVYFLLMFIISFLPALWLKNERGALLGTTGDFISIPNIREFFTHRFSVLNLNIDGGYGSGYHLPQYIPYYLSILGLDLIGFGRAYSDYLFIFGTLFFNSVCVFIFLRNSLVKNNAHGVSISDKHKAVGKLISLIFSLLFSYSPFFTNLFGAGHFLIFPMFGVFALALSYVDRYLLHDGENIEGKKVFLIMVIVFFLVQLPFSNIGNIVSFFISLGIYILSHTVVVKNSFRRGVEIFIIMIFSFLVSNMWWLVPAYLTTEDVEYQTKVSKNTIGMFIDVATEYSDPVSIFLGQPEGPLSLDNMFSKSSLSVVIPIIYLAMFIVSILFMILKKKGSVLKLYVFLLFILFITLLIKGPRGPFPFAFNHLYKNVGLMQIFRRPSSKLYFSALLMITGLFSHSFYYIFSAVKRSVGVLLGIFPVTLFVLFYIVFIIRLGHLREFIIPNEYYRIKNYVEKDVHRKILFLPDLGGVPIIYNGDLDDTGGVDFQYYFFLNPTINPNANVENISDFHKNLGTILRMTNYDNFCALTKQYNIGYIIVRKNIKNENLGYPLNQTMFNLLFNKFLVKEDFGIYSDVFSVSDQCLPVDSIEISDLHGAVGSERYYETMYMSGKFSSEDLPVRVRLHYKRNNMWRSYLIPSDECDLFCKIKNLRVLKNESTKSFLNKWVVKDVEEGSNYAVITVFIPDIVLYVCFVLTILFVFICSVLLLSVCLKRSVDD